MSAVKEQPTYMDIMATLRDMSEANDRMAALARSREQSTESFSTAYDEETKVTTSTPLPGLQVVPIEEWEAEMKHQADQRKNSLPSRPSKKKKPRDLSPSDQGEPVLLPSKTVAANAVRLNDLIQIHGLSATYDFCEELPQCFSGTLTLSNGREEVKTFATEGDLFASKKLAKEKIAQKACLWLVTLPKQPKPTSSPSISAQVDTSENWMGILNSTFPSSRPSKSKTDLPQQTSAKALPSPSQNGKNISSAQPSAQHSP